MWEDLERWRSRPLEPVYAFMFVDCLYVPVRDGRGARNAAVYAVLVFRQEDLSKKSIGN